MSFLKSAHLNITMECNFRCKYCFESHNKSYMNLSTAMKAIDFLDKVGVPDRQINLNFFGGEPLLNYEVITGTVAYANAKYPNRFNYGLVTNCSLLNDEIIKFLKEHNIGVLASYDGKITHDRFRCGGTSELVEENIKKMLKAGLFVNSAMTLVPGETQHMFENFMSINALGVRAIAINHVVSGYRQYDEEDFKNINEQYDKLLPVLIEAKINGKNNVVCPLLERHLSGIKKKAMGRWKNPNTWACGACRGSLGVWPDGTIMPCHEMSPEVYPHWYLGNVNDGTFNEEKRCEYQHETYRDCDLCEVTNCGHCRTRAFSSTGNEDGTVENTCRYQRLLYTKAIIMFNELAKNNKIDWIR